MVYMLLDNINHAEVQCIVFQKSRIFKFLLVLLRNKMCIVAVNNVRFQRRLHAMD